jgi:hypothetical protein
MAALFSSGTLFFGVPGYLPVKGGDDILA